MRRLCLCIVFMLHVSTGLADQDPARVAREWRIQYERDPVAVFAGFERGAAVLRLPDGSRRLVELWMLEGRELAYLQRQRCTFPAGARRMALRKGKHLLIDLSSEGIPVGRLPRWENKGALGGAFHALVTPPTVEDLAGRRAVRFEYGPAVVAMELNTLAADFLAPPRLMGDEAFTVAAWLHNPGAPQPVETFLSWHTLGGDDGTDIRYGKRGRRSFQAGAYCGPMGTMDIADDRRGAANAWHHVAHVFTGGPGGRMLLYVDGRQVAAKAFERTVRILPASQIRPGGALLQGRLIARDGGAAKARFYVGRRDGHYWARVFPDEPDRWNRVVEVDAGGSGVLSARIDGLQPATDYVWRIQLYVDDDHVYWSDGIGRFRTAGGDGKGGKAYERESRRHVFVGSSWGSTWDWTTTPRHFFTGAIASLKVYDYALGEREIRNLYGTAGAFSPSPPDGSTVEELRAVLAWKAGAEGAGAYRVYLGTRRADVAGGVAGALLGETRQTRYGASKLAPATSYYWRVDEVPGAGKVIAGNVWSFATPDGSAGAPVPPDGARGVSVQATRLQWRPGRSARRQMVYFDTDRSRVADGTARTQAHRGGSDGQVRLDHKSLEFGRTYYWRVAADNGGELPPSPGAVWSFRTAEPVECEPDGPVVEPYPRGVRQDGSVTKVMECGGQPILAADDTPDVAMLRARTTCLRVLAKRPDLNYQLAVSNTGGSLTAETPIGWTELVRNTYGATRNMMLDRNFYGGQNMLMHEMGHQLHMNGMSNLDDKFDERLYETWLAAMRSGKYLGCYEANNMWEYIACAASAWINDGSEQDETYPRDRLRRKDPRLYALLNEYWSGDRRIELHAGRGVRADADGTVRTWDNVGGVLFWGRRGWQTYPRTTGRFLPRGRPRLTTAAGVSAVTFSGTDALVWDQAMRSEMGGGREWSVELWARSDAPAGDAASGVLVSWGAEGKQAVRLRWPAALSGLSTPRRWRHIVFVYGTGGKPRLFVDGRPARPEPVPPDVATGGPVVIGGVFAGGTVARGFRGAIAHGRFYDYDMHPLQIARHYRDESPYYARPAPAVGGRLLVDLDARLLGTCPRYDHRPLYPASLNRPWLRSWANLGALGGKLANNVWRASGSTPLPQRVRGVRAVRFQGKDRMASDRPCEGFRTVEAWVCADPQRPAGTVLEAGSAHLRSDRLAPGAWHYVALVRHEASWRAYVDGRPDGAIGPADRTQDRLHVGAHWDGWRWGDGLHGAVARVRLHSQALTARQVADSFAASDLYGPVSPCPPDGGTAVAARRPALTWQAGAAAAAAFDLYLGTDASALAGAGRTSSEYVGRATPGEHRPKLAPGREHFWRVDALGPDGRMTARGRLWRFSTCKGEVLRLDAADLSPGPVERWAFRGKPPGAFVPGRLGELRTPSLRAVDGHKGLDFMGDKLLRSDVPAPRCLTAGGPFTVVIRTYDPRTWQHNVGVLLCVGRRPGRTLEFGLDTENQPGALRAGGGLRLGFEKHHPRGREWHTLAWTYGGKAAGTVRLWLDGRLSAERQAVLSVDGGPMTLACAPRGEAGSHAADRYRGLIGLVVIYDRALAAKQIAALSGPAARPDQAGKPLVHLDAEGLTGRRIASWANAGRLGGSFRVPAEPDRQPLARTVAGRRAVVFDGVKTFLQSTSPTPAALAGRGAFTVEMIVHNPALEAVETVAMLAPERAKSTFMDWHDNHSLEFNYGQAGYNAPSAFRNGTDGFNIAWPRGAAPEAGRWHHLAWVYDGGMFAQVRVYVDGKLRAMERGVSLETRPGRMFLGTAWNTEKGPRTMFSGAVGRIAAYDYARTAREIKDAAGR